MLANVLIELQLLDMSQQVLLFLFSLDLEGKKNADDDDDDAG